MAIIETKGPHKLVLLAAALALALSTAGCAAGAGAGSAGPLSSHGVDYAPSFNPDAGVGG